MPQINVADFAKRCGGALFAEQGLQIEGFATDHRDVKSGDMFICIKGENFDGHEFAAAAVQAGAVACICTRHVSAPHVLVNDIAGALASFGRSVRSEFSGPVIGLTGSVGKTTTKEFTAAACAALGSVVKSQGNKNTEYTSPLLWAEVDNQTAAVVVEMGMRGMGQIAHLASIARPTIGVVTQIGTSHMEMVGSRAGIAEAKSELLRALPPEGTAVVWQEDTFLSDLKSAAPCKVLTFGFTQEADCRILGYRALSWERCAIQGSIHGEDFQCELPTVGRHQALNAAAALTAACAAGAKVGDAARYMEQATLPPMRLQVVTFNSATLVLDTYNASPDSTVAAIATLAEMPTEGRRLAILGEMRELGQFTESGHRLVGAAVAEAMLDKVLLTGGPTKHIADQARSAGFPDDRIEELSELDIEKVRGFLKCVREGDTVLIKGSRALGLERAVEVL